MFIVLDTETTGLYASKSEILEFAAIKVNDDGTTEEFHTLIKPQNLQTASRTALGVNGYLENSHKWDDAPLMGEVGDKIADFCRGAEFIVGHNIKFDLEMIEANFRRYGVRRKLPFYSVDTQMLVIQTIWPIFNRFGIKKKTKMDYIREILGFSFKDSHTALKDTRDTLKLFQMLFKPTLITKMRLYFAVWNYSRNLSK